MLDKKLYLLLFLAFSLFACGQKSSNNNFTEDSSSASSQNLIVPEGQRIQTRIRTPEEFERLHAPQNSFAAYLRNLILKPHAAVVKLYDGNTKFNHEVYVAVVDKPIGKKNLHQCADAIMRLRAEYLWERAAYDQIHFNLTNGFRVDYSHWMQGQRVVVKGNKTNWVQKQQASNTYEDFWNYLELVFTYAGTLSLSKELIDVPIQDMQIGDVFIQGGAPGHAVIVVDMAQDAKTGDPIFLLAQSYMPAQEIQLLKNPNDPKLSPWYNTKQMQLIRTPEWTFKRSDLKRFE